MTVFVAVLDCYIVALCVHWCLTETSLRVHSTLGRVLKRLCDPYVTWVNRSLAPTWRGKDASMAVAALGLLLLRLILF